MGKMEAIGRLNEIVKRIWQLGRYGRIARRMKTRFSHHVERGYDLGMILADPGKQGVKERRAMAEVGMIEKLDWTLVEQAFLAEVGS